VRGRAIARDSLRDVQRRFFALLTAGERAPLDSPDSGRLVVGDRLGDAGMRLAIYSRMYFDRLHDDVLRADYPKLEAALGAAAFELLARDFLAAHPPDDPQIRFVSAPLPAYLRRHALGRRRPWLGDLAALEWARVDVFDRADARSLTMDELRALPPQAFPRLPLRLIPACRLLRAGAGVEDVWRRLDRGDPAGRPGRGARALLVWRDPRLAILHRRLEPTEAQLLGRLAGGARAKAISFGRVCALLGRGRSAEAAAREAWRLVGGWVGAGIIRTPGGGGEA
jgi:hypothetical protein